MSKPFDCRILRPLAACALMLASACGGGSYYVEGDTTAEGDLGPDHAGDVAADDTLQPDAPVEPPVDPSDQADPDAAEVSETPADTFVDPCDGVTCTGHGRCVVETGATCLCDPGYHSSGLDCIPDESCDTVTCSGHGTCVVAGGEARCYCETGYHAEGLSCVSDSGTPCDGVTCSGHGTCQVRPFIGSAECVCDPGYVAYGLSCIDEGLWGCRGDDGSLNPRGTRRCGTDDSIIEVCRDADGDGRNEWAFGVDCVSGTTCAAGCLSATCDVQPCPLENSCVESAHDVPLWACVVTCDCSNCGNCDMQDFVDCGGCWTLYCGSPDYPATVPCTKPCPSAGDGCIPYTPPICWGMEGCMSGPYP